MSLMPYLMTLSEEEMRAAVGALSKDQRSALIAELCGAVDELAEIIVKNKDEIWQTGELPTVPCSPLATQPH